MEASTSSSIGRTIPASTVDGGAEPPQPAPFPAAKAPPPFLVKTYKMVDDPSTDKIVSWSPSNNSFVVWDLAEFCNLLPKYFKHKSFASFVRQLNTYILTFCRIPSFPNLAKCLKPLHYEFVQGFRKIHPDRWEYANERFLRGKKHLLKSIKGCKKASVHRHNQQQIQSHAQGSSIRPCVEVGKFGLEEEVERLKRDKNVLMQELVRLRQQQQTTDTQLQAVVQRFQGMEQCQQQMMSFLIKAMSSPQFLAQFLQQQNENNWCISQGNKKRRVAHDGILNDSTVGPADGQIVKYQPSVNEAAQAMLREIVELNSSPRLENFNSNPDTLPIGDGSPQSNALHSDSSLHHVSGVTLQEVPPTCGQSFISSCSSIKGISSSGAMFEMPSSSSPPLGANCELATNQLLNGTSSQLIGAQGVSPVTLPTTEARIPQIARETNADVVGSSTENPNSSVEQENLPLELSGPDTLIKWDNSWMDETQELPGLGDPFWENFFESPNSPETQGMGPILMGDNPQENNQWENYQHMEQLTGQMGLLSSDVSIV